MPRKISWKKGMRLSDEVLRAADNCTADHISHAIALAAGGRFGLFPSSRPFQLQLNITKGYVDVEALSCLAITRGGYIIDVDFDTKFTNDLDGRVQIPGDSDEKEFLLTINIKPNEWKDSADGYMTPVHFFNLVSAKSKLPDTAMPVGRIVNEDGWREDSTNFVPPCITLSSHPKFEALHGKFLELLNAIDESTRQQTESGARVAIGIFWPVIRDVLVTAKTEHDVMTPQRFLACVQRVVMAFVTACELDDLLNLQDADTFYNYAKAPYHYRLAYLRIKQGLGMCYAISEKVGKFGLIHREEPKPAPPQPETPPQPVAPAVDPRRRWDGLRI